MAKIFSNLGLSVVNGVAAQATGMAMNYFNTALSNGFQKRGPVRFYYNYGAGGSITNVLAKSAIGIASKLAQDEIMNQYKKLVSKKSKLSTDSSSSMTTLIKDGLKNNGTSDPWESDFGKMKVNGGKNVVFATDCYGNPCIDAFMMGVPLKNKIPVSQKVVESNNAKPEVTYHNMNFSSDTLVWWDCTAIVTVNSERNLIATRVAGRDYSRKELVSNGDISISVTGRMNSHLPDIYPSSEVKKFIQIMNYKGAIKVNSQFLSMLGIDRIVIQNFNMPQKEGYKNLQDYTFTAIGMQPSKETKVENDTIVSIDNAIQASNDKEESAWKKMLNQKLESIKSATGDALAGSLSMASGMLQNSL